MTEPKQRFPRALFLRTTGLAIITLCCSIGAFCASLNPSVEADSYPAPQGEVLVDLALDRIGLVSTAKTTAKEIVSFAAGFNLKVVQEIEAHSFVLELSRPLSRAELLAFVRQVEKQGEVSGLVQEAGLVLFAKDDPERPILLTDEMIVRLADGVDLVQLAELNNLHGVELVRPKPIAWDQYLLRVTERSDGDALTIANIYHEHKLTRWAVPNFWAIDERYETNPDDPLFGNQWHHRNTGQGAGLVDADSDTSWAWDYTEGSPDIIIAIIDDGFDIDHEDLAPNLYTNPLEIAGNGIDDDGNGYVDDVNGWDFVACDPFVAGCGDNDPRPVAATDNHGTAVAGVALARSDNLLGVAGSCPQCSLLPIRRTFDFFPIAAIVAAFQYASIMDADFLNNSWGAALTWPVADAMSELYSAGVFTLCAAVNADINGCSGGLTSHATAFAVTSTTNQDRKVTETAYGSCIDVMAPSHRGYDPPYMGTLDITTTDRTGTAGYNNAGPGSFPCAVAEPGTSYTNCFGGTSAATPLVAGVAGLILTVAPDLSSMQLERLIQDTADKIEPGAAEYHDDRGFSDPAAGDPTHAWGRINAWEAVRVVAPAVVGGRNGIDIFMRDNRLDWGNTTGYQGEQASNVRFEYPRGTIGHWRSRDIKVDAPPYHAPLTASDFDTVPDESPSATPGDINRVFVRVRNRGPDAAATVNVKLLWSQFGTALPALPGDFWAVFPGTSADPTSAWHALDCSAGGDYCTISDLGYSGASVATYPADLAQVVQFDFPAPTIDPMLANHFCLLALADSPDDPIASESQSLLLVDSITPNDNNVTHRNYHDLVSTYMRRFNEGFLVRNPLDEPILAVLRLTDAKQLAERKWQVQVEPFGIDRPFELAPGKEVPAQLIVTLPDEGEVGEIEIIQERVDQNIPELMGGLMVRLVAEQKPEKEQ
jgi:subtilisin family serine protease